MHKVNLAMLDACRFSFPYFYATSKSIQQRNTRWNRGEGGISKFGKFEQSPPKSLLDQLMCIALAGGMAMASISIMSEGTRVIPVGSDVRTDLSTFERQVGMLYDRGITACKPLNCQSCTRIRNWELFSKSLT